MGDFSMAFLYQDPLPLGKDQTKYRKLTDKFVSIVSFEGQTVLKVDSEALVLIAKEALKDVAFLLRTTHLEKLAKILKDPEASDNDRYVALTLLKNAEIAAKGELPGCQDTGTAIVVGKKGQQVWTYGNDAEALSKGIYETYQEKNLRYSQMVPLNMMEEKNSGSNLPAQIDIYANEGAEYKFLFMAKGGGSANKTYFYQETKSLLNDHSLAEFVFQKIKYIGTSACPPYHLALVIGGTSAESNLKILKLATAGYLDDLPTIGNEGGQAFRDLEWEDRVAKIAAETEIGAQFGGKYFVHDVRVIRLPRHAASCPVGMGVSCSADRNIKGKINKDGIFLEQLELNPGRFLPKDEVALAPPIQINLNQPIKNILQELSKHPIKTRLSLSGSLIVARDIAHAKLKELLDSGKPMPDYFKNYPVYYAGPAKTPIGKASGSFGPTTAGRMDSYVKQFMAAGGSFIMLAKGNRSVAVRDACKTYGGFYLGSIGGPGAILAEENIKKVEVVDFPELGMEAIRKITVENFPAFIICDDKGNDFFEDLT
jgi:fumarate hydratase class I